MKPTRRLLDDDGTRAEAIALLQSARRTRPISAAARSRSSTRIAPLVALPFAAATWLWVKGLAIAAGLSVVGAVVVVGSAPLLRSTDPQSLAPVVSGRVSELARRVGSEHAREASDQDQDPAGSVAPETSPERSSPISERSSRSSHGGAASGPTRGSSAAAQSPRGEPRTAPRSEQPPVTPSSAPTTSAVAGDPLAREAALLEAARVALAGSPAEALSRLEMHATEFPNGKLTLERELLVLDALRRLGRHAEVRARGEALVSRTRGSLYEERVRRILATIP